MSKNKNKDLKKPKFDVEKLKKESVRVKTKDSKIILDKNNPNDVEWYE